MATYSASKRQQGGDEDYSAGVVLGDEDFMNGVESALFLRPEFADVVFLVGRERFHAHRAILAFRSEYFRAMLYGGLSESSKAEVKLKWTIAAAFRVVLQFIYGLRIDLSVYKVKELLDILRLAHEYRLTGFQKSIAVYLETILDVGTVFTIAETSKLLSLKALTDSCMQFCDRNALDVLRSRAFTRLPQQNMMEMLSRNTFYAPEIEIFRALTRWIQVLPVMKPDRLLQLIEELISKKCLRLHLMSQERLLTTVRHSTLFAPISLELNSFILDAIEASNKAKTTRSDAANNVVKMGMCDRFKKQLDEGHNHINEDYFASTKYNVREENLHFYGSSNNESTLSYSGTRQKLYTVPETETFVPTKNRPDVEFLDVSCGIISVSEDFAADVGRALFLQHWYSDATFVVEDQRFCAHKFILATRCYALRCRCNHPIDRFYGGIYDSPVELKGTNAVAFRAVLQYIYGVQIDLSKFNTEEVCSTLRLAHEYNLFKFQEGIVDYLKKVLNVDNVFAIAETSEHVHMIMKHELVFFDGLPDACRQFCDEHALEVLKSKEFSALPLEKVIEMLSRDSFWAPEIEIFHAVTEWIRAQPEMEPNQLLQLFKRLISEGCLRLHLISQMDLLTVVRRSTVFASNSCEVDKYILDAMEVKEKGTGSIRRRSCYIDSEEIEDDE